MLFWLMGVVCAASVIPAALHQRHPVRRCLLSALGGCCALGLVNALTGVTGVAIALNWGSAFLAVVMGVPGVVLMLLLCPLF